MWSTSQDQVALWTLLSFRDLTCFHGHLCGRYRLPSSPSPWPEPAGRRSSPRVLSTLTDVMLIVMWYPYRSR